MTERSPEQNDKSFPRKVLDKAFFGVSLVTFPLGLYVAGTSFIAGEVTRGIIASGFAFVDYTQIKEHGQPREKQSWYNPERIIDSILGKGSGRLQQAPTTRMAYAAS